MSETPFLQLRNIGKHFGSVEALNGVDLSLERGKVLGILGDNGSGKSTLIRVMAGYHEPSEGEIYLQGQPVQMKNPTDAKRFGISTVHQNLGLVNELSIARNFFLGNELHRYGFLQRKKMNTIVQDQLQEMGISIVDPEATVAALSGGERQAIAFCRAWYFGKSILILDEPTSALSVKGIENVLRYIQMAKEKNMAVILITHNLQHAQRICDNYVVLHHGKKVAEGSPAELDHLKLESLISQGVTA